MGTSKRLASGTAVLLLAGTVTFLLGTSLAMGGSIGLDDIGVTAGIDAAPATLQGKKFYQATFSINYPGSGTVIFSANDDGTGNTLNQTA